MEETKSRIGHKQPNCTNWATDRHARGSLRKRVAQQCVHEQFIQRRGADVAAVARQRHAALSSVLLKLVKYDVIEGLRHVT